MKRFQVEIFKLTVFLFFFEQKTNNFLARFVADDFNSKSFHRNYFMESFGKAFLAQHEGNVSLPRK